MTSSSSTHREQPQRPSGPDWAAPSTSPSRRAPGRSATARTRRWSRRPPSSRSRAGLPSAASVTSRQSPGWLPAAHPPAQLVQLGDAEPVGVQHDHHGGVGRRRRRPRPRWCRPARRCRQAAPGRRTEPSRRPSPPRSCGRCSAASRSPASGPAPARAARDLDGEPASAPAGGAVRARSSSLPGRPARARRRTRPSSASIRGHTTYTCRPAATSSRTRCQARAR